MHRRPEFSFPGSPAPARGGLPPRPPANHPMAAPRYGDDEEARWLQASPDPDYYSSGGSGSGTPSPQLWASRPEHHHHQLHRQYPASAGSSPSRAQAIAGYRREMLDLVRGLPESAYELSLRDIVEHHHPSPPRDPPSPPHPPPASTAGGRPTSRAVPAGAQEKKDEPAVAATADAEDGGGGGGSRGKKKQGRTQRTVMRKQRSRSMERSVSLDTGLLIKLFLPLSIGGKKKVSPKPDAAKDGKKKKREKKQGKKEEEAVAVATAAAAQQEEEWWTKSEFSEAGSSSRTSSTGSSNSNSSAASVRNVVNGGANPRAPARSWSRKRTGCYAFFRANKGKNGVNQD
ncbi:uncharacterized protein [Miscanthus floridulus]|uniref:uncharacterized protein n=1 Tax=Miscanthus floridulus TaxID=154761 RepID=UPI00345A3073